MNIRVAALAGVCALALSGPALADENVGWYLGLGAGYDHIDSVKVQDRNGTFVPQSYGPNDSILYTGSGGYKFPFGLRLEAEVAWTPHRFDQQPDAPPLFGESGHLKLLSAMGNVLFDTPVGAGFDFTFGAGAGEDWTDLKLHRGVNTLAHSMSSTFQWQAMAGVSHPVFENLDAELDFRYRSEAGPGTVDTTLVGGPPPFGFPGANVKVGAINEEVVMLGLRYYLFHAAPPPPPPPYMPPPAPAAVPVVKTFIVFFDFDKANLTAEAQSVVSEAVKTAQRIGAVKIVVTGHADTVGSDSYNLGLSVRRAESVKDEMVREGLDAGAISIQGKGYHDPLVATGPGVREPRNRRAVIDLGP